MRRIEGIAELGLGHGRFLRHQLFIFRVLDDRHAARDARFAIHKAPGEETNRHAPVEQQVDLAAEAFGVDDAIGEHFQVHQLVLAVVEELRQRHAVFLLEDLVRLAGLARHPVADDGVHRVVGAAAVHADPAQLLGLGPLGEFTIGTGMLDHVADFVGGGHIPAEVMVAGVDDEDVAFAHFDTLFDHLAGVDVVVAADIAQVDDRRLVHQEIHIQRGDILARRVEVDLAVQVGAQMIGMGHHLPVGAVGRQALEVLHLQRLIGRPGRVWQYPGGWSDQ